MNNKAITVKHTATTKGSWDGPANEKRLKEDQTKAYYSKCYAWVDPEKDETTKSAYKFPHHEVSEDGSIGAANVSACHAVIESLNGGRGGAKIPSADRKGVWNHVAAHLRDAGEEPAPLKNMKQNSLKPFFKAQMQEDNTLEMCIYESIGENWDGSGVTAANVKEQLDNSDYDKIVCRVNSPGGDVFEGIAIHNLLKSQKKPVEMLIDGIAASSASIIAMAGNEITMGNNAMMMIHNAWSMAVGNADELRKQADTLDKVSESIAQTYVDRTGNSLDDIKKMMNDETWMSAQDCIKNGFATKIAGEDDSEEPLALARSFKHLKNLKNVPQVLKNDSEETEDEDMCQCDCKNCPEDCSDCVNKDCDDPNCKDCPMQNDDLDSVEDSNLSLYEARLSLIKHRL